MCRPAPTSPTCACRRCSRRTSPDFLQPSSSPPASTRLRDEGRAYADRLIDAGVKTTYVNYPGTIHGFFSLTRFLKQGLKANDEAAAVMGAFFGT
jgi:acetyl esterase/lipase